MDAIVSRLLSRKFILSGMVVLTSSGLMYFDKISDGVYSTIIVAVSAAYLASNVVQKSNSKSEQT